MSTIATGPTAARALNFYLLRSSLVAALGGLLFGFDTAVISGTTSALSGAFSLSPAMLGVTVSAALWGTVLGSLSAGPPRFFGFALMMGVQFFVVLALYPETKAVSLENMERL